MLPVLWRDTVEARLDAKLDRAERTLLILGLWLEDDALARDDDFAEAMARGLARFLGFLDAERADVKGVPQASLRRRLSGVVPKAPAPSRSSQAK